MSGVEGPPGHKPKTAPPSLKGTLPGPSSRRSKPGGSRKFGPFVLKKRLGGGGVADVYEAFEPALDRTVAVKVLQPDLGDAAAEARLMREAEAVSRLDHPNVISVHEVGRVDGQVFLAMELIRGQTVKEWAMTKRTVGETLRVYRKAAKGLAAAHAAGLVHRDFKPSNVMLAEDGRVVVMDFGLARARLGGTDGDVVDEAEGNRITARGEILGTPAFMAPEQFATADVGPAADQFSFCVSLWRSLYDSPPYGESANERVYAMTHGKLAEPDNDDVPRWLRTALARGLAIDSGERHPSMDALLSALTWGPWRWLIVVAAAVLVGGLAWVWMA